jgi:hypothetical protein
MAGESKTARDLERLKRQIGAGKKNLAESVRKTEDLDATIKAEIQSRQHAKTRRKNT